MNRRAAPVAMLAASVAVCGAENWPQFRGPRGDGTSSETFPAPKRKQWKVKLPGPGHSSPIVWGDRIFLTAFEPETSTLRRLAGIQGRLLVMCLNRKNGRTEWQREVRAGEIEKTTSVNKPASPTPVTDGTRVYAYFGSFGIAAFTMDGRPVWETKLGPYPHHMGSGSSPVLDGGSLILNAESDGPSYLYAIAASDGHVEWRVPRKTRQAAYSTAVVQGETIAVAGHGSVMAYARRDGRGLWTASGLSTYVVPTLVFAGELWFATSNGPGGNVVMALRPGGEVAWRAARGGAYIASPAHVGGRLFTVNQNCVVTAIDARAGRVEWQQRLETQGECYASPVAAENVIHIATTAGELFSLVAGGSFDLRGKWGGFGRMMASPAISGGVMYVRSDSHLHALLP